METLQSAGAPSSAQEAPADVAVPNAAPLDDAAAPEGDAPSEPEKPARDPRYPLNVLYCPISSLPVELLEYLSGKQFEK